jgi:hypothetical protein
VAGYTVSLSAHRNGLLLASGAEFAPAAYDRFVGMPLKKSMLQRGVASPQNLPVGSLS